MIEERGRVVAVDGQQVWVETTRHSACGGCSAKSACGQGLMSQYVNSKRNYIRLISEQPVNVDDHVLLGLPENILVRSALLAYGVPLALFVVAAGIVDGLFSVSEPWVILAGVLGLMLGFVLVRVLSNSPRGVSAFQPVILQTFPAVSGSPQASLI